MSGITDDGRQVVSGVFELISTHGIPLDVVLEILDRHGMIVDWLEFYRRSLDEGWNPTTTFNKIEASVLDIYGKDTGMIILDRLKNVFSDNEK